MEREILQCDLEDALARQLICKLLEGYLQRSADSTDDGHSSEDEDGDEDEDDDDDDDDEDDDEEEEV
jgi:hypothetical protein